MKMWQLSAKNAFSKTNVISDWIWNIEIKLSIHLFAGRICLMGNIPIHDLFLECISPLALPAWTKYVEHRPSMVHHFISSSYREITTMIPIPSNIPRFWSRRQMKKVHPFCFVLISFSSGTCGRKKMAFKLKQTMFAILSTKKLPLTPCTGKNRTQVMPMFFYDVKFTRKCVALFR